MRLRGLTLAAIATVALGGFADPASAHATRTSLRKPPPTLTETAASAHFAVHYSVAGDEHASSPEVAARTLELAERAWAVQVGQWGYPRPLDDGDGRVDIYIQRLGGGVLGFVASERTVGTGATGYIGLDSQGLEHEGTVAHEFFHLVQLAMWSRSNRLLMEATADWVQVQMGYPQSTDWRFRLYTALDCNPGEEWGCLSGHERWVFIEFLTSRYGPGLVRDLFERARAERLSTALGMLRATLTAHGTTVEREYEAFSVASLYGGYASPHLKGFVSVYDKTLATLGRVSETFVLNHLAAKTIMISPAGPPPCRATTLRLRVTLPPGTESAAYLSPARAGELPTPLSVSDGVATGVAAWTTCPLGQSRLLLLANTSATADDQQFTVEAEVVAGLTPIPPPAASPFGAPAAVTPPTVPPVPPIAAAAPAAPPAKPTPPAAAAPSPPSAGSAPKISLANSVLRSRRGGRFTLSISSSGNGLLQVECTVLDGDASSVLHAGRNRVSLTVGGDARPGSYSCSASSLSSAGTVGFRIHFKLVVSRR